MPQMIRLPIVDLLKSKIQAPDPFLIQVILGPRQVGKTTAIQMLLEELDPHEFHYVSADGEIAFPSGWILEQWNLAKQKAPAGLLVIDEVQKVENWSEIVKKLWDEQKNNHARLRLILLGSSSLDLKKGLSESLAGRFRLQKLFHWDFSESRKVHKMDLEEYLRFGGYPGSYPFVGDRTEWLLYMKESIVGPVLGKDILSQARVKSPALFKQCFDLACSYGAQVVSYTKLLGQLQDKGNTDLVKYYLELFEGAFLIRQIHKFSQKKVLMKGSSPKLLPLCPALYSIGLDADLNLEERGHSFEIVVGAALTRLPGNLYYWRERNVEVDYVYQFGKKLHAIEVKSGRKKGAKGLTKFKEKYPQCQTLVLTPENYQKEISLLESKS